ncbi:hypothetical protein B0H14DRAFT_700256 [Mycena olivaceomarginata]|nr:hypothetical protein B0H14DRAFT_700256 [Mycena olivaceomarginata]
MKKTVIKRRKRVPAAGAGAEGGGAVNAMSDQAAAEALVAVGRSSRVSAPASPHPTNNGHPNPTDDDAEDAPRRKRQRRKAPAPAAAAAEEEAQRDMERERERDRERKRPWFPTGGAHTGPFDLPPLERGFPPFAQGAGAGGGGAAGGNGQGGYLRGASAGTGSGSVPPSRGGAGSPANGVPGAGAGYALPPVRAPGGYYHDGAPNGAANGANTNGNQQLTIDDLERHYFALHESRRKTEELLRETERIMGAVKRNLDEMRAGGEVLNGNGNGGPEMVPLRERERGRSREGASGSVWPVNGTGNGDASMRE